MRQSLGRVVGAVLVTSLVAVCALLAQSGQRPTDPAAETYRNICAGCHGATLSGGRAPTLLDDTWRFGGDDASITQSILDGRPGTEMAPFRGALTDAEVTGLVAYIRRQSKLAVASAARAQSPAGQTVRSERRGQRGRRAQVADAGGEQGGGHGVRAGVGDHPAVPTVSPLRSVGTRSTRQSASGTTVVQVSAPASTK